MPHTYKARLRDNQVTWISKVPDKIKSQEREVYITFTEPGNSKKRKTRKSQKNALILEELALANTNPSIKDPSSWQKEAREDRHLPGRES